MINKTLGGHYRVVQPLGEGGLAKTYIAEDHHRPGHPQCVVKCLKPASNDPNFLPKARELFNREAEILEELGKHDQVPRLLAYFEDNQEFYLVQELIAGHTLNTELPPGHHWSEGKVIELLQDVLPILTFVHSYGVIHRDIKPSNLIRRNSDSRLVLIDFGAVKQIREPVATLQTPIARATIAIGTEGYMPTEQVRGKPRLNSDIYALGMIGIQALTGIDPADLQEDADGEVIWRDQAQISDELAAILTKMVRYHFKDRYQLAIEVLKALQALVPEPFPRQPASDGRQLPSTAVSQVELRETRVFSEAQSPASELRETRVFSEAQPPASELRETRVFSEAQPPASELRETKISGSTPMPLNGCYQIVQTLMDSGLRQTSLAQNLCQPDNPRCIVKRLRKLASDAPNLLTAERLFRKEAETLEKLGEHDQIPKLLARFEDNQAFYLVQECIEGQPLSAELLPNQPWTENQVVQFLKEVLSILEFVHSQGVIHRDIKPDNIIRRQQDNRLVLIDFGAIKEFQTASVAASEQVSPTIPIGTPGYMPTEQGRGKPRPSSDIYALGIMGIQALTGLNPRQFPEDPNTGEIFWRQQVQVSNSLAAILAKMIRYHFKDRYQSATEALQALNQLTALPEFKLSKNRKLLIVGLGTTVAAVAIAIGFSSLLTSPEEGASSTTTPGKPSPTTTPTPGKPSPTTTSTLKETLSKKLEDSLRKRDWKTADETNYKLMLTLTGDQSAQQGRFNLSEWNNFSCANIKRIDDLWSQASNGMLGFSAQKKLFERAAKNPNRYYDAIKWKKQDSNELYVIWEYNDKKKTTEYLPKKQPNFTNPPEGHLPAKLEWEDTKDRRFEKIYACEL